MVSTMTPRISRAVAVLGIYSQFDAIPDDCLCRQILTAAGCCSAKPVLRGELDPGGSDGVLKDRWYEIAVTQSLRWSLEKMSLGGLSARPKEGARVMRVCCCGCGR